MNDVARRVLEAVWRDQVSWLRKCDVGYLAVELQESEGDIRNAEIERRAQLSLEERGELALADEFTRRIGTHGFPTGFVHIDVSDVDEEDEPWAAALELAAEDYELHPLPPDDLPQATAEEICAWVQTKLPPSGWRPKYFRLPEGLARARLEEEA